MKLTVSNANITNTFSTARVTLANTSIVESLTLGNVSVTPAQITIGNTSITPTAVSVPSLILGGSQFSGGLQGGIINYQEFTANGTWYNPYANAFVNTSLTGYEQVLVMAWGAGAGGLSVAPNGGGAGGGACFIGTTTLLTMTNTCSVTVGLGGGNATNGGNSVFVVNSTANIVAYGGSGSISATIVGAGAGTLGLGTANATTSIGGNPLGSISSTTTPLLSTYGGGAGSNGSSSNGGSTIFGGGGGGGFGAGNSVYGGGGGSGATTVGGAALVPGTSIFGGRGANTTSAAQIPGGGGSGGSANFTGARGEVRVWVFGPAGTTAGAPTYSLTANTTTLYEGSSVLYTFSTTNVANGTTFYYTLNNSSTAVSSDFTTAVNGSVIVNGGTGTFTLTANNDTDSVNEAFQIDVRTVSESGTIVASNGSVSIVPIIDFVGSSSNSAGVGAPSSISVAVPAGVQNGDLLIAIISHRSDSGATYTNASWTESLDASADPGLYVATRIASSEPASYTWTISAGAYSAAAILAYRGASLDVVGTLGTATSTSPAVAPSITTTSPNGKTLAAFGLETSSGVFAAPSGYTQVTAVAYLTEAKLAVFTKDSTTAGATGTVSSTFTGNTLTTAIGALIGIKRS